MNLEQIQNQLWYMSTVSSVCLMHKRFVVLIDGAYMLNVYSYCFFNKNMLDYYQSMNLIFFRI